MTSPWQPRRTLRAALFAANLRAFAGVRRRRRRRRVKRTLSAMACDVGEPMSCKNKIRSRSRTSVYASILWSRL
ncbi:hypothetical protein BOTBODRAFT_311912 [Botryobasidium botryosum FD-172 SS1]|uniref:Uncharacterized protein n=1 Tax=Botryobasidium botryosum (strain FD-172 SS1) TaxID=930990 RepID=A0A067N9W1_BOTB1|nr:hypothetical protein BOTBODRAFT_311912 [Botryobasidium botryosum FD-172 SS1]